MWSKGQRLAPRSASTLTRWQPSAALPGGRRASDVPRLPSPNALTPAADEGPTLDEQLAAAHAAGVAEGRRQAEEVLAADRGRLAETIAEIAGLRRKVFDAADHELMQLAVGMARRILHRELQLDPDILLAMARVALARLGDRAIATAYLHPEDLAAVAASGPLPDGLSLAADPGLPRGGCRLAGEAGEIDLGVDAQMNELSRQLLGEPRRVQPSRLH